MRIKTAHRLFAVLLYYPTRFAYQNGGAPTSALAATVKRLCCSQFVTGSHLRWLSRVAPSAMDEA